MASSSSSYQQNHELNAFSGFEPPGNRRKVSESAILYDVFINHRGPDVKQTLAARLYNSFEQLGIRAFLDSKEKELGNSFPSIIETAICSAKVHIAIFSKTYAESPWCLAELVLMLKSTAKITPLFYQVKPFDLRYIEGGAYAEAFNKYREKSRYLEKLSEWKEALQSLSLIDGEEFYSDRDYREIVAAAQKDVQRKTPLHVAEYPVGLNNLVDDFRRRCLDELVQDIDIQCGQEERKHKAKVIVTCSTVMDILKKSGSSLVIVTTRDVGVLITAGITVGYNLKGMGRSHARELFCWHAFDQAHPCNGYEELSDDFVNACGGLPLSLQVLGRHVRGRNHSYWSSELTKGEKMLHWDVKQRLRISFDSLDNEEKQEQ
ncbi:disease resistance protein RML1B-like [Cryptomeria japonica]|uniref:disease resistance protein RML1B-like n=1 Tax=Cryptomeria japonica TaxID=3369 RepID=UPI0027DA1C5C|nr:disease resistance protein RML1B-like [Cryptomeria japonica]